MSLYKELLNTIKEEKINFNINLCTKEIKVKNKKIKLNEYKELISNDDLESFNIDNICDGDFFNTAEKIYELYRKSIPSRKDKKSYFKALPIDELTDEELVDGLERNFAQFLLEAYVLLLPLQKEINFDNDKWFYQGENKNFILIKKWLY